MNTTMCVQTLAQGAANGSWPAALAIFGLALVGVAAFWAMAKVLSS